MKKYISAVLSVIFSLSVLLSISAAAYSPTSGNIGYNISWELDLSSGTLSVYGYGNIPDYYSKYATPWNAHSKSIRRIQLHEGIERVGNYAFSSCEALESVYCYPPNNGPGLQSIGDSAFAFCENLSSVLLPKTLERIGASAFYSCNALTKIDLPKNLTSIGESAFNGSGLEKVVIPNQVTEIGDSAFSLCMNLKTVDVSNSVIEIGKEAFSYCSNLESMVLPCGLTCISEGLFRGSYKFKEVSIPVSVTAIGPNAFSGVSFDMSVVYEGSCKLWEAIEIAANNDILASAKRKANHNTDLKNKKEATCTAEGYTGDTYCVDCNTVVKTGKAVAMLDHEYAGYVCKFCGAEKPVTSQNPFTDVFATDWYFRPVLWAVEKKVTGGKTANTFAPNENCTRAQVVTFLWAANGKPEPKSSHNPFHDVANDAWYLKPVLWAVENGITGGTSATTFGPDQYCTRAQVVTFLYAGAGKPEVAAGSTFEDVADSDWFAKPVIWAKENEVTGGISPTEFGPNNICTRAQVVTFLYKVYN